MCKKKVICKRAMQPWKMSQAQRVCSCKLSRTERNCWVWTYTVLLSILSSSSFLSTRRCNPLCRPSSSCCGGLRPSPKAFILPRRLQREKKFALVTTWDPRAANLKSELEKFKEILYKSPENRTFFPQGPLFLDLRDNRTCINKVVYKIHQRKVFQVLSL